MNYTYNSAGFMEKIIDPSGDYLFYGYNAIGRRIEAAIQTAGSIKTH